jgi:hypothetical protein
VSGIDSMDADGDVGMNSTRSQRFSRTFQKRIWKEILIENHLEANHVVMKKNLASISITQCPV